MTYYVYIIQTINNTLYCGSTNNVIERYNKHKEGLGAKYTRANKPQGIVYVKVFDDKKAALKEEYRIKHTLTKTKKLELIETNKSYTKEILDNLNHPL